jgi:hypothetical protein
MNKMTITGEFQISDGYHTMEELYEHRIVLWIELCRVLAEHAPRVHDPAHPTSSTSNVLVWRSAYHSDGARYPGWFLLGYRQRSGEQISYHIPEREWGNTGFAELLERAPEFDCHTSDDVLNRLRKLGDGR